MNWRSPNFVIALAAILGLIALGVTIGYALLPEERKRQLLSLGRQRPEMPGSRMV